MSPYSVSALLNCRRYERYELLTRSMNTQQYLEFTECRAANFTQRPQKLREWLSLSEERASPRLLELLGFLCYEAVRRLVETGLLSRDCQTACVSGSLHPDLTKQESTGQFPIRTFHPTYTCL